jgi:Ion channel
MTSLKKNDAPSGGYFSELSIKLFKDWRHYRLISGICATSAIIPVLMDYEISYSPDREIDVCRTSQSYVVLRIITLLLSFVAIILHFLYRDIYYKWLKNIPFTYKELEPYHRVSVLEVMEMQRKRKFWSYLLEGETPVVLFLFLIFPYPGDYYTFTIPQQFTKSVVLDNEYPYEYKSVCYYFSELWYAVMYLRLAYLVLATFSYGKFQTNLAMSSAEKYGVKINPAFSIKCYVKAYPLIILVFYFLIPGIIVFGILVRLFERPLSLQDFNPLFNSCWYVIITMTTVGYGDMHAISILGRAMTVFSIFWGGIILSLTFVTVGGTLQLSPNEKKAYNAILVGRGAADAIGDSLVTSRHNYRDKSAWAAIRFKLRQFIQSKNSGSEEAFITLSTKAFRNTIETLENKVDRIYDKLKRFGDSLE